jgi:hypothetical protein
MLDLELIVILDVRVGLPYFMFSVHFLRNKLLFVRALVQNTPDVGCTVEHFRFNEDGSGCSDCEDFLIGIRPFSQEQISGVSPTSSK